MRWISLGSFRLAISGNLEIKAILTTVYQALQEKGYNPINQIVGIYSVRGPDLYHQP